jgi:hypothetical protein
MSYIPLLGNPAFQGTMIVVGVVLLAGGPLLRWWNTPGAPPEPPYEPKTPADLALFRQMVRAGKVPGVAPNAFPDPMRCPQCEGSGKRWNTYQDPCKLCGGTCELAGELKVFPQCRVCNGTGKRGGVYFESCRICSGYGVRIPEV